MLYTLVHVKIFHGAATPAAAELQAEWNANGTESLSALDQATFPTLGIIGSLVVRSAEVHGLIEHLGTGTPFSDAFTLEA